MRLKRVLEQHIAVFGESGSGKTVLVSSFYGATQEPQFLRSSLFDVTADDTGQGHRLHANFLGMRDSARSPGLTRFSSTPYAFSVKLRDKSVKGTRSKPFDAMRLVWHDYPGEWFEKDVSGSEEAQRRVATFRSLLGSDVAIMLVDGQKLLDNAGEEGRYLKSLLGSFRSGLRRLEDQLLEGGKPLVRFPRIWILALSKADLLPGLDVFGFRDLVISTASDDLAELRKVLEGFVDSPDALAVGEDFLRLSSAKFEPNRIEVAERIGLDLVLPAAAMLPFERHMQWVKQQHIGAKVADDLLAGVGALASVLFGKAKFAGPKGLVASLIGGGSVNVATDLGRDQLKKIHSAALAKHDYMAAVLTRFALDLDDGEEKRILLRSRK
jgi:double-GTPase-like protein